MLPKVGLFPTHLIMPRTKRAHDDAAASLPLDQANDSSTASIELRQKEEISIFKKKSEFELPKSIKSSTCLRITNQSFSIPLYARMPDWLKPLLYCQQEHGYPEEWLCYMYQSLPPELLDAIQSAFLAVITLGLDRMHVFDDSIKVSHQSSTMGINRDSVCCNDKPLNAKMEFSIVKLHWLPDRVALKKPCMLS